jgi:hypothetical protein
MRQKTCPFPTVTGIATHSKVHAEEVKEGSETKLNISGALLCSYLPLFIPES